MSTSIGRSSNRGRRRNPPALVSPLTPAFRICSGWPSGGRFRRQECRVGVGPCQPVTGRQTIAQHQHGRDLSLNRDAAAIEVLVSHQDLCRGVRPRQRKGMRECMGGTFGLRADRFCSLTCLGFRRVLMISGAACGVSTLNQELSTLRMANFGINGFGRIGRNVSRHVSGSGRPGPRDQRSDRHPHPGSPSQMGFGPWEI